jgi:modulator of FtsH protease
VSRDPAAWQNYFVAQAGASAALVGLIFVAVSLNLRQILRFASLPARVAQALIILGQLLVVAMIVLIPGQDAAGLGVELIVVGSLIWAAVLALQLRSLRLMSAEPSTTTRRRVGRVGLGQIATLPTVIAGLSLVAAGGGGLLWLAAGTGLALVVGVFDAWVLLIEIMR